MLAVVTRSPAWAAGLQGDGPSLAHGHGLGGGGGFLCGLVRLVLALLLSWVLPVVQHHGKAARFGAGLLDAPQLHIPDGAADGLPVQLRLIDKRFSTSGGYSHAQPWGLAVSHKCLLLASGAGQALDCASGQIDTLGYVWRVCLFGAGHADCSGRFWLHGQSM